MTEEHNPFQSPETCAPVPEYPVPEGLVRRRGRSFASGHARAICAMIALGIVALFDVASICFDCLQYKRIVGIQHGERFYYSALTLERLTRFAQAKLAAEIATVILYSFWIHRAYRNLPALGNPVPSATPEWAVGSYFVPVVNFFIPYTIMAEIWRYSDPAQLGVIRKNTSRLVGAWWGMFWGPLIPLAGMYAMLLMTRSHALIDEIEIESLWGIGVPIMNLAAAVLAIVLIYTIDRNQRISDGLIAVQHEATALAGTIQ